ncbi:MAG: hypothetical protein M1835_007881 [Candelina submexicana]|nr:MAG: hypothetical protein M1835_007881 [Candelina submexicana]
MAETSSPRRSATPSIPQKRTLEDEHVPAVPSPLNPDVSATRSRAGRERAPAREQREKKESLKKRESKGPSTAGNSGRGGTPDGISSKRKTKGASAAATTLAPLRYNLPAPKATEFSAPRGPTFTHHSTKTDCGQETEIYETSDHVYNRKNYRYTHCIADRSFPSSRYYRQSETEPFHSRINFEDASSHILFTKDGKTITTDKGFRMARANVGVREGKWYWECKITSGVTGAPRRESNGQTNGVGRHVRIGWARREAALDGPVGFDAYSYGIRDVGGQKVHMSRPKDFFPPGEDILEGDVVGLEINLPSLSLHRKVVEGQYNPAVDVFDELDDHGAEAPDIIRDRIPITFKGHLYFEQFDYHPTKELEELMNPSPVVAASGALSTEAPNAIHSLVPLRTLPFSCIKIYKNGRYMGTPWTDLLAFLPPASRPPASFGAREGLDDGMLGYFPAVSVFRGGAAEMNFGPDFWCPLGSAEREDVDMIGQKTSGNGATAGSQLHAVSDRYNEQIAEDIVYDLVDEVDFWMQDGGSTEQKHSVRDGVPTTLGPVDPDDPGVEALAHGLGAQAGEIKEIVQEDE